MGDSLYNAQLFAQAMTTPAMISHHQLTPPPTVDPSSTTTIKMEDLSSVSFGTPEPTPSASHHASTPPPSDGKPAKKRKSWGQVLPEPKTNLPPRKRAKTEDEKEQRRIERVKRNRLAAHNSRERKRQEVELLQHEKDKVEANLKAAQNAMARMAAQLKIWQQRHPNEVMEDIAIPTFDMSSSSSSSTTTSANDDYESPLVSDTICPRQTSFPSPVSMNDSLDSPRDESCQPETPAAYAESIGTESDQTRYPAAILCDLQCQSDTVPSRSPLQLQATLAFLILFNLTLPTTRRLLMTCSALRRSLTPSMWNTLLASWRRQTSSPTPSSRTTPQILTAFLTTLMLDTSTCRQPLAQPLLATRLSQLKSSSQFVARPSGTKGRAEQDGDAVEGHWRTPLDYKNGGSSSRSQRFSSSLKPMLERWLHSQAEQNHDKALGRGTAS